jgi:hypothetical protein
MLLDPADDVGQFTVAEAKKDFQQYENAQRKASTQSMK